MKSHDTHYGLVTGAAGLLGIEHCKSILDINNGLIMVDINKVELLKTYKFLKKIYPNSLIVQSLTDITSEKEVKLLSKSLNKTNIFVRTLINNACIDPKPQKNSSKKNLILKTWNKELDVGLKGSYHLIEYFAQNMKKKRMVAL